MNLLKWTTSLSILATFDHPVLLMFPGIPNIFVCVLLFSCLRAPRLSEQYPGIPIWIVQTEAYCSFTPLLPSLFLQQNEAENVLADVCVSQQGMN